MRDFIDCKSPHFGEVDGDGSPVGAGRQLKGLNNVFESFEGFPVRVGRLVGRDWL